MTNQTANFIATKTTRYQLSFTTATGYRFIGTYGSRAFAETMAEKAHAKYPGIKVKIEEV